MWSSEAIVRLHNENLPASVSFHKCYLSAAPSLLSHWLVIKILRNKIVRRAHRPGWRLLLFPEHFGAMVLASSSSPLKLKIPGVWSCQLAQGQGFYSLVWPGNGA